MPNSLDHGTQRLGLLTSSKAGIIMGGTPKAWARLSRDLWLETADQFIQAGTAAMQYGHAHEAEGAAKFWDRHPEVTEMLEDQFLVRAVDGVPLGCSPDRVLHTTHGLEGLEIKSPTTRENFRYHELRHHRDQCQHGMLVTGINVWWLVVHHGEDFEQHRIESDAAWQAEYSRRAKAFWTFHTTGKAPWN